MAKVKFELNHAGAEELLKSPELSDLIGKLGEECAASASSMYGREYVCETSVRGDRVTARISAGSIPAHYSNLKHNTLVKALKGLSL